MALATDFLSAAAVAAEFAADWPAVAEAASAADNESCEALTKAATLMGSTRVIKGLNSPMRWPRSSSRRRSQPKSATFKKAALWADIAGKIGAK